MDPIERKPTPEEERQIIAFVAETEGCDEDEIRISTGKEHPCQEHPFGISVEVEVYKQFDGFFPNTEVKDWSTLDAFWILKPEPARYMQQWRNAMPREGCIFRHRRLMAEVPRGSWQECYFALEWIEREYGETEKGEDHEG